MHQLASLSTSGTETETPKPRFSCSSPNHGPTVLLEGDHQSFFGDRLKSGVTSLNIPTDLISEKLIVDLDNKQTISQLRFQRSLRGGYKIDTERSLMANYDGFFRTLVVRVSDNRGHTPTYPAYQISNHVFGRGLTMVSYVLLKILIINTT